MDKPELDDHCKHVMADAMAALGTELLTHYDTNDPIVTAYCDFSDKIKALIVSPEEEAAVQSLFTELQKRLNAPNN